MNYYVYSHYGKISFPEDTPPNCHNVVIAILLLTIQSIFDTEKPS